MPTPSNDNHVVVLLIDNPMQISVENVNAVHGLPHSPPHCAPDTPARAPLPPHDAGHDRSHRVPHDRGVPAAPHRRGLPPALCSSRRQWIGTPRECTARRDQAGDSHAEGACAQQTDVHTAEKLSNLNHTNFTTLLVE